MLSHDRKNVSRCIYEPLNGNHPIATLEEIRTLSGFSAVEAATRIGLSTMEQKSCGELE
ncbi:hypothetical protein RZS28_08570 [Methylocapsa polymorpha]|uniref:Uncharacterized protein n=1 Tax=Methylocapsa polymorpha TaxID=3080828 RepID=A0ABZ0HZF7_9HYPH|nr:hypothetical protein RZS28_08570 [Methylocapsa sp. RX1]